MEFSWLSWLIGGILGMIIGHILFRVSNSSDGGEIIVVDCSGLIENPEAQDISTGKLYFYGNG